MMEAMSAGLTKHGKPTAFVFGVAVGLRPTVITVALLLVSRWQIERYASRLIFFYAANDPPSEDGYARNLAVLDIVRSLSSPVWTLLVAAVFVATQIIGARLAGAIIGRWEAELYTAASAIAQGAAATLLAVGGLVAAQVLGVAGMDGSGEELFPDGYIGGYWPLFAAVYVPVGLAALWVVLYSLYRLTAVIVANPKLLG